MSIHHGWLTAWVAAVALAACGQVSSSDVDGGDGPTAAVTIVRSGAAGTVTSAPAGLDCGATCTARFALGAVVTLTATTPPGVTFTGWGGACDGDLPMCSFVVTTDVAVDAAFALERHAVTVTVSGSGGGAVASTTPAGLITCPGTCTAMVDHGTPVAFQATPDPGASFLGWSGSCVGMTCALTVDADVTVTAAFGQSQSLVVTRSGSGTGTVTSPPGISCGADCDQVYPPGAMVTLTQSAGPESRFVQWSGACTGTGPCDVTMNAAATVDARFDLVTYALTVARSGAGVGSVTSVGPGIACGVDCTEDFPSGTMVNLQASAGAGSTFAGWSGACTNVTGACVVTMSQARAVTARFEQAPTATLTLSVYGPGTVSAAPSPSSGPSTCSSSSNVTTTCTLVYPTNAAVMLTAAPTSTFVDMFGCALTGTSCQVTMSMARAVTAYFCGTGDPCPL